MSGHRRQPVHPGRGRRRLELGTILRGLLAAGYLGPTRRERLKVSAGVARNLTMLAEIDFDLVSLLAR